MRVRTGLRRGSRGDRLTCIFGYGIDYAYGMGGGHVFPSVWREAFGSRAEARAAGVADLIGRLSSGTDKRKVELLRRLKKEGQQRMLFE